MRLALLADHEDTVLLNTLKKPELEILATADPETFLKTEADVYLDLLFEEHPERLPELISLLPRTVIVCAVQSTLAMLHPDLVRINGWKTFLERPALELVCKPELKQVVTTMAEALSKQVHFVPDIPGMLAPRVVAMIVNEACFALNEKVSTREEIDTAMKLGTNYPFGPFEWAGKIGMRKIAALLDTLARDDERYIPAPGLPDLLEK